MKLSVAVKRTPGSANHSTYNMTSTDKPSTSRVAWIRKIIVWFAVVLVAGIGGPWFMFTTTIHRADLPVEQINQVSDILNNLKVKVPVYFTGGDSDVSELQSSLQGSLNQKLYQKYPLLQDFWSIDLQYLENKDKVGNDLVISLEELDIPFHISPFQRLVSLNKDSNTQELLADVLLQQVFPNEIEKFNRFKSSGKKLNENNLILPYSPTYNLIFSLFIEDGNPVIWEPELIDKLFNPLLTQFSHISNFTISTQVQYYSKTNININTPDETGANYMIKETDLSNFINFGDWNLNNNDINPSINFIIYFPHSNHEDKLLTIENSATNSFLIPQYGGVYIMNKKEDIRTDDDMFVISEPELLEALEIFSSQLFKLLGVSNTNPKNTLLRIDSLTRLTTYQNLLESIKTLKSLINLTNSLNEISVPELTKSLAKNCLDDLVASVEALSLYDFKLAMIHSSWALTYSTKAFFDKEIVQQVYFPSEHKLAVFLPLLGPLCSILFFSSLRQVKEFKQSKTK